MTPPNLKHWRTWVKALVFAAIGIGVIGYQVVTWYLDRLGITITR